MKIGIDNGFLILSYFLRLIHTFTKRKGTKETHNMTRRSPRNDDEHLSEYEIVGDEEVSPEGESGTERHIGGAAVAGGLAGLLLAGPVVAVVTAGGAAVMATTNGKAGDVARASGAMMATAGDRLKKIEKKHHIVEKTGNGMVKGCNWVTKKLQPKSKRQPDTELTA